MAPFSKGIREEMAQRMPSRLQPLLTLVTGKPLLQERPAPYSTPMNQFLLDLGILFGVAVAGIVLVDAFPVWGLLSLPVIWIVLVGRLRALVTQHGHEAAHGAISSRPEVNHIVAQISYTIALAHNPSEFKNEHDRHHALGLFLDARDPDRLFVESAGLRVGLSEATLRRNLWSALFGLGFHARMLTTRLRLVLWNDDAVTRAAGAFWIAILMVTAVMGPTVPFLLVVLPSFVPLFQGAALLQILSEHDWSRSSAPTDADGYADATWARFCGDPLPPLGLRGLAWGRAWTRWWLRLMFIHAPVRTCILVRGLPAHDFHHVGMYAGDVRYECANILYARSTAAESAHPLRLKEREIWGFWQAIKFVLTCLASAEHTYTSTMRLRLPDAASIRSAPEANMV